MGVLKVWTAAAAVSFILGCSPGPSADQPGVATPGVATPGVATPDAASSAAAAGVPPPQTVFDPLTQQLQKAKGVQDTADANAEATRRAVEQQERGDNPQ